MATPNGKGFRETAFETEMDPIHLIEINQRQGLYLLHSKNSPIFVAMYDCDGHHHQLPEAILSLKDQALCTGLSALTPDIALTFEHEAMRLTEPVAPWRQQLERADEPALQALIMDEMRQRQSLSSAGKRQRRTLTLCVRLDANPNGNRYTAWTDLGIEKVQSVWTGLNGRQRNIQHQNYQRLFASIVEMLADVEGKLRAMDVSITPWSVKGCYDHLMGETCRHYDPAIPNLVHYDAASGTLGETHRQELDYRSARLREGAPIALPDAVKIKDKWVAVMVLENKPYGWDTPQQAAHYLWNIIKDVPDIKVVTQLCPSQTSLYLPHLEFLERLSRGQLFKGNITNTKAEMDAENAVEIRRQITSGARPYQLAVVILVYRDSRQALEQACRTLSHRVQPPALLTREVCLAPKLYLQCQPYSKSRLLAAPFNRRLHELSENIPPFLPLIVPQSPHKQGFELIAEGNTPIYLDFSKARHLALFATTRAGKSVLVASMLVHCLAQLLPVLLMDFPGPDGTSTYTPFTKALGGAYVDIRSEKVNLFELPDAGYVEELEADTPSEAMQDFYNDRCLVLIALVLGTGSSSVERQQEVETIIGLAVSYFLTHPDIQARYRHAYAGGFGSDAWMKMPTLHDFIAFLVPESFVGEQLELTALHRIKARLQFLAVGPCRSLAGVSSVEPHRSKILAYALTNVSDDRDAYIMGLMFYIMVLRRASMYKRQIVFVDEASILFKYDSLAKLFGKLAANGAKYGVSLWVAAQDAETIYHSPSGAQIFANLSTILIGRIKPSAIATLEKVQNYDRQMLLRNTDQSFGQDAKTLSSEWLLDDLHGHICHCRVYISPLLLAMVANNPAERTARDLLLAHYEAEPLRGMVHFSELLRYSLAADIPVDELVQDIIAEAGAKSMPVSDYTQHCWSYLTRK